MQPCYTHTDTQATVELLIIFGLFAVLVCHYFSPGVFKNWFTGYQIKSPTSTIPPLSPQSQHGVFARK